MGMDRDRITSGCLLSRDPIGIRRPTRYLWIAVSRMWLLRRIVMRRKRELLDNPNRGTRDGYQTDQDPRRCLHDPVPVRYSRSRGFGRCGFRVADRCSHNRVGHIVHTFRQCHRMLLSSTIRKSAAQVRIRPGPTVRKKIAGTPGVSRSIHIAYGNGLSRKVPGWPADQRGGEPVDREFSLPGAGAVGLQETLDGGHQVGQ